MEYFSALQDFVREVKLARDLQEVEAVLGDATHTFGFDHFALIQRFGATNSAGPLQLTNYPTKWIATLLRSDFYVNDPVLAASEKSVAAFGWDELPTILKLSKKQQKYMDAAKQEGLVSGFTVPIHVPGEATGLCSFVTADDRPIPAQTRPAVQYLACFAFEAARRIACKNRGSGGGVQKLTQRQLECIVLAARGKSNWVAGELLGLSQQTVHKYIETAKKRYGVSSRTELVVRALYDGHLTFSDVLQ